MKLCSETKASSSGVQQIFGYRHSNDLKRFEPETGPLISVEASSALIKLDRRVILKFVFAVVTYTQ